MTAWSRQSASFSRGVTAPPFHRCRSATAPYFGKKAAFSAGQLGRPVVNPEAGGGTANGRRGLLKAGVKMG
ncbi:MAG: hypothetical protein LBU36_02905 [Clostridiales bacterium]|nr:hypothetical protein [Clostridiales bacterium]